MLAKILISVNQTRIDSEINKILHTLDVSSNHPDVLILENGKLNLEQAKLIKEFFIFKPHQAIGKIAIAKHLESATIEAQNSLLKTLEELPENALIVMTSTSESIFLPTILSRCEIIKFNAVENLDQQYLETISNFVNMTMQERFYYIEKLKDKEEFLFNLIKYFQVKLYETNTKGFEQLKQFLNKCLEAEKWDQANGNIRGILEYLALNIPKN